MKKAKTHKLPVRAAISFTKSKSWRHYPIGLSLILIIPLCLLLGFGFVYPVGRLLGQSFFAPDFGLDNYRRLLETPLYLRVLGRTVIVALIVMAASLALGYPVALAMARLRRDLAGVVMACVLLPLWTSALVRSYAWIVILQRRGLVNDALLGLGVISEPLKLIYTEGAVILAMTHVLVPFMILPIFGAIRAIPTELVQAARNLGGGQFTVFARILLPLSLPGIFAGCLMTFILALGFYVTPALVGGPSSLLMATLIGQQTTETLDWGFAGALSTVLLCVTLVIVVCFRKALSNNRGISNVA
ncbi:mannopine transport system permease protein [Rhizobium petrolearium]|uniref:ABC transporter permease n=1 Tax=Neorhizobium petrolearium TaxID=515361 RepID=UPI001AE87D6E|nr:ABC transporter permease [Neorhizobium petrolearium]MBP1844297.1 mannopine transport system permease protein [Neorhizobium petrolearium]